MVFNRAHIVDRQLVAFLEEAGPEPSASTPLPFPPAKLLELFESQLLSRQIDLVARELKARDASYYTIGSSGHEGNVVLGELLRHTDPAFLHYRSGALMLQRGRKLPDQDLVRDTLLGLMASSDDPVSGGRHKVWGSRALWVPPQTSTIASHLPKALGAAMAIDRAARLDLDSPIPADSIVVCTFGDASTNHSTAQGSFNTASWLAFQRLPVPLLFVCEDNGLGISVPTPPGWIEASMSSRAAIRYLQADGLDLAAAYQVTQEAVSLCRRERCPVFLHLRVARLLGHAGSDIEQEYRSLAEIESTEASDPLIRTARLILAHGLEEPSQLLERYRRAGERVRDTAEGLLDRPKLTNAAAVMEPLAPYHPERVEAEATRAPAGELRRRAPIGRQRHMAGLINRALHEMLLKYPQALVFGEDVARKGGVYHVTANLWKDYGPGRVFNTVLDEQGILGLAIGAAHVGFLPLPEIQYLAYLHNAEDQLRGEACSLQFFSRAQFQNPMVVRIASFAYQRGFGGHFHNDNSVAALRDMPGLIIACPARGDDAVAMLRTCLALAAGDGRVVAFLEPIALYMTKDLHEEGDGEWLCDYPPSGEAIPLGEGRVYHPEAGDLTIVSYANGLFLSLRAARRLADAGIAARVLDLRWLNPLNLDWVAEQARATGRLLVVDECRRAGALGEGIAAGVAERCGRDVLVAVHAAEDSYIPLGPAMQTVLPRVETIEAEARALVARQ